MSAVVQHPRAVELVERAKLRRQVERAVSRLIAILDELDTDPEAEPWLGAPEPPPLLWLAPQGLNQRRWTNGSTDDREEQDEDGGDILDGGDDDQVDGEPSLGAIEAIDQSRWTQCGSAILECCRGCKACAGFQIDDDEIAPEETHCPNPTYTP